MRSVILLGIINISFFCMPCLFTPETMVEQGNTTWPSVVPSEPSEAVKE